MEHKVISPENLPTKVPVGQTLVVILLLREFNAPDWVWAAVLTIWGFFLLISFAIQDDQKEINIFETDLADRIHDLKVRIDSCSKRIDKELKKQSLVDAKPEYPTSDLENRINECSKRINEELKKLNLQK
jgi:hypothetical protein